MNNADEKQKNSKKIMAVYLYAIIAFLVSFIIHIIPVFFYKLPSAPPDELGALSMGASVSGYDWSFLVSSHGTYYSFVSSLPIIPLFYIFKNSLVLYFFSRVWISILLSIPTIIAYIIIIKHLNIKNSFKVFLVSVSVSFFHNTSAVMFTNEAAIILLVWITIYLIIELVSTKAIWKKIVLEVFIGITYAVSTWCHTKCLVLAIPIGITLILFSIINKKFLFIFCSAFSSIAVYFVGGLIKKSYKSVVYSNLETVLENNTIIADQTGNILDILKTIGLQKTIISVITVFVTNLNGIVLYSCLIILPIAVISFFLIRDFIFKRKNINDAAAVITIFCFSGLMMYLLLMGGYHCYHGYAVSEGIIVGNGRFLFYLRYLLQTMPPLLIVILYNDEIKLVKDSKVFFASCGLFVACVVLLYAFFGINIINHEIPSFDVGKIFGLGIEYFKRFDGWNYYLVGIKSIFIFFCVMTYCHNSKMSKVIWWLLVCALFIFRQNMQDYSDLYPSSEREWGSIEATYKEYGNNKDFCEKYERIYVKNSIFKMEYCVQLLFPNMEVRPYDGEELGSKDILFSGEQLELGDYCEAVLDEDEYVYYAYQK